MSRHQQVYGTVRNGACSGSHRTKCAWTDTLYGRCSDSRQHHLPPELVRPFRGSEENGTSSLGLNRLDESCCPVSKRVTSLLRHHPKLREEDGAVEWRRLLFQCNRSHFFAHSGRRTQELMVRLKRGRNKAILE